MSSRSLGTLTLLRPRADIQYISNNLTVLSMRTDGSLAPEADVGLFVCNTRIVSRYHYQANGRPLRPVALSPVEQNSWLGYYLVSSDDGDEHARHTVEVRLSRHAGDGLHEDLDVTSFSQEHASIALTLDVEADFADIRETRGPRRQHGKVHWDSRHDGALELRGDYHAEHPYDHQGQSGVARFDASVIVRVRCADAIPSHEHGRIHWKIELAPRASWHCCVDVVAVVGGRELPLVYGCHAFFGTHNERDVKRGTFRHRAACFSIPGAATLSHTVMSTLERAKSDLGALRLYDLDHDERTWTVAAGLPTYVGLFGRDTLAAGTQAAVLTSDILAGTVIVLPRWQGREVNDWRDEQPGRMPHQLQTGPLSQLQFDPFGRSYSSVTASAFYPVAVSELWHWTGDRERIGPLIEPALRAMRWIDADGDLDGDHFYEYQTRSEDGLRNQGWKDSSDAIVHADGSQVCTPIATCEEQGFVYLAKLRLAELLFCFGRREEARRLFHEARELKRRFNEVFWMPDAGYFAMGLDRHKRQIRSMASDPGLCLATGIVEEALAEATATRMLAADMFSGWGVRTLSSDHPAYDPYSYHRGSVWPVDQGAFALGLARYGLHGHVALLARSLFETARLFEHHRLPECFAGHARDLEHPFPAMYPKADWPQAWSAASVFTMLQALLGIYPFAPLDLLLLDPALPDWLPEITISNLHVGSAVVDIRFCRDRSGETRFDVLERRGTVHILRQPSPWSIMTSPPDRLWDVLSARKP
ncbi:Glycogen debranching enzyme [Minicystis rosea]|nr:Glycogen debranching enzyme [Minicystis rosea]